MLANKSGEWLSRHFEAVNERRGGLFKRVEEQKNFHRPFSHEMALVEKRDHVVAISTIQRRAIRIPAFFSPPRKKQTTPNITTLNGAVLNEEMVLTCGVCHGDVCQFCS